MIRCLVLLAMLAPAWAHAAELVMFERADCPVCLRWDREVAPIYPKTPESHTATLRRVTLGTGTGIALAEPVRYTPTFVLVDDGHEVGRITGYLDDAMFWGLLDGLLKLIPQGALPGKPARDERG